MTGCLRVPCLAVALLAALLPAAASAQTREQIARFMQLSDRFDAQLPRPRTARMSDRAKRARAVCILSGFEGRYGGEGLESVMALMQVLARGAEFDDPTIVAFNDAYGQSFNRLVTRCTNRAGGA